MNCTEQNKIIVKKARKSTKLFFSMNFLMNSLDSLTCLFKNVPVTRKMWRRETDLINPVFIQVVPSSMSPVFSSDKVCHIIMVWNQYKRYEHLTISVFFLLCGYILTPGIPWMFCIFVFLSPPCTSKSKPHPIPLWCPIARTDEYIVYIIPSCSCVVGHIYF